MILDNTAKVDESTRVLPANQFRHYCLHDVTRAERILDLLFESDRTLPEILEKHLVIIRDYLTGGETFEKFAREVQKFSNHVVCGLVWTNFTISYRCRTCAINPCMSLCSDCFHRGNHQGHDANMFRSLAGGICDCGDMTVMNASGFCKHHGPQRIPSPLTPVKLLRCTEIILPRLILRFVQHLRSRVSSIRDRASNTEEFLSLTPLFDLFDDLCHTGSAICSIFTRCLLNVDLYDGNQNDYLQQWSKTSKLHIPISLRQENGSSEFDLNKAKCLLDEILFWLIKYQIPERVLKLLLMLFIDTDFKKFFTQAFLNIYPMAIVQLLQTRSKTLSSRLEQITVQLFSNSMITIQAIEQSHLLEILLSSLYSLFSNNLIPCRLQKSSENYHRIVSDVHFYSIVSDLINVLVHPYASRVLINEKRFFITWLTIISWFQGMNVQYHQIQLDRCLSAFTAENQCCAMVLWTLMTHIRSPEFLKRTSEGIHRVLMITKEWLSAIGARESKDFHRNEMTFHLPLHRYLSILTSIALNYQNGQLKDLFPNNCEHFLLNLARFPLRIQQVKYEIHSNRIWISNQYEMQMQMTMYSDTRANLYSYMNDADIYLLQLISNLVNSNRLIEMIFQNCNLSDWLIQDTFILEKFGDVMLLEGSLIILATIVAFSPYLALDDYQYRRTEIINALAIQDCCYSYLEERFAQSKGLSTEKYDIQSILDDVAEYSSPSSDMIDGLTQGQYKLKDFLWEREFDPLHVRTRISRRDSFESTMQRYVNWVRSTNPSISANHLWPPYRLHQPKDQFQANIRVILQSRYLHGLFFSICQWMIDETILHEDILALLVYLCELTIDDQYRRLTYGEFLDDFIPSARFEMKNSISLETLSSLEDEVQQEATRENPFKIGMSYSICKLSFGKDNPCHRHRMSQFNQISTEEQEIQKRWDELILKKDVLENKRMSYSMPSYDLENQFQSSKDSLPSHDEQNHSSMKKLDQNIATTKEENKKAKGIVDGKYETYYNQDNFLINAHTIIEEISFERMILDVETDAEEYIISKQEIDCVDGPLDRSAPLHSSTVSIQTNSKQIIETKSIGMSLVQMLVHLLGKIVSKINETSDRRTSLNDLFETMRKKKGSILVGDGSIYLTRLLIKLERLSEECQFQIQKTIDQLDQQQTENPMENNQKKEKTREMQEKLFEDIAKRQQKLLMASNDEQDFATAEQSNDLQCCICRNEEINSPVGLVVRIVDTGVVGIREMKVDFDHQSPLSTNVSDHLPFDHLLTCCDFQRKLSNNQQPPSSEFRSIDIKSKDKNDSTCAQFHEEKIRSLLKIFPEKNVSKAVTISWRTGLLLDTCGHFIHFSCYQQHLQSHSGKNPLETDVNIQFKCPMCRQTANGFICIPPTTQPMESNEDLLETITDLIERNSKPCVSPSMAESIINLTQNMYSMLHKSYRTIDQQEKQLNDDILALFLISILRFNLENDLLIRDTEHISRRSINRKTCFREFFYLCYLNYSHLSTDSSRLFWQRLIGVVNKQNINEPIIPLLLSDPIALLLQILLRLPYNSTKEFYQIIVQMLFNLTYIQSLFAIVMKMNFNEREIWSNHQSNQIDTPHLKTMAEYLQLICWKFTQSNFSSEINESEIRSLESIHASIQECCGNFIQIAGLIQHHLYQPIVWWNPGCEIPYDELRNNLIRELRLYGTGEPYWFGRSSITPLLEWLDEVLIVDQHQWKIVAKIARSIPSFHSPRFIELPKYYSDLLRICTRLHCPHCHKLLNNPMLCLICGIIYPCGHFERKCCDQQTHSMKEHLMQCSGGVNISINIDSTKTLIQRQQRYTYWSSLYLDEHGEEDLNLRRGRILYLNADRLKLLYSAWISSNLDQITHHWAIDALNF